MIRGVSFQKGVYFIGRKYLAVAYEEKGRIKSSLHPITLKSLARMLWHMFSSMPWYYHVLTAGILLGISLPLFYVGPYLPSYFLLYYAFGMHFFFPMQMRKYHGAEHKVFSYKGVVSSRYLEEIKKADIRNRNCSTNIVVLYFITTLILVIAMLIFRVSDPLFFASYAALIALPFISPFLRKKHPSSFIKWILQLSRYLQVAVTTAEPEDSHLKVAIRSYRRLGFKEMPHRVIIKSTRTSDKKPTKKEP
ncbi:DUF1385 domain-containing protein [Paenalkalicoccus suaedae]|uniref:DUF1385 domain-containing protein n=1 Tax=Paenalkalicoccus suaedae TaxID=2592382 RepID=A0A859FDW3_9BACI|nr:DUF1385 domain-containing protein [Paenalkalicoccus suaedae]QKS70922.1 DUF1385 domain-containing protein [Paenalkalicoccus suaedae]